MKKVILIFAFVFCGFAASVSAQTDDKAAVRVPVENYIK
jgi:hypothetical protein